MELQGIVKSIVAFFGAVVGFLYGGLSGTLIALLVCILFDFITGVAVGLKNHTLSSKVAFEGILKKFGIMIIVSLCHILDVNVLEMGDSVFTAVTLLFIGSEGISLVENVARLGVPIPKKLYDCLEQLKGSDGGIYEPSEKDVRGNKGGYPPDTIEGVAESYLRSMNNPSKEGTKKVKIHEKQ